MFEHQQVDPSRPTVLVVEDETIVATDLQRSLKKLGFHVPEPAACAAEALQSAAECHPDLVLMDIRLRGGQDGIETARLLRQRYGLPVVYLTAYGDSSTLDRAKRTQPLGYLLKPFKPKDLRSTIEMALHRAAAEKRMRQRARWLGTVLNSFPDAVVATTPQGKVRFANREAERLLRVRQADLIGRDIDDAVHLQPHKTDSSALKTLLRTALEERRPIERSHHVVLRNSRGALRPVSDTAAPIFDGQRLVGGLVSFRDATEQQALQTRIDLSDRLTATGKLAATMTHELNNPLTVIAANLSYVNECLQTTPEWAKASADAQADLCEALEDAQFGVRRIRRILDDVSFDGHGGHLPPEPLDSVIAEVLRWAVQSTTQQYSGRARVVTTLANVPHVAIGETRLGQVLINLLNNALQAFDTDNPETNLVNVTTNTLGAGVQISIVDNGCGIPDEIKNSLFDPYVTTKNRNEGTGLGLFICHSILQDAGGTIEVESQGGSGTTFKLWLPAAETSASN